jgi:hypothetical protein
LLGFELQIDLIAKVHNELLHERWEDPINQSKIFEYLYQLLSCISLSRVRDIVKSDNIYLLTDVIDDEMWLWSQLKNIDISDISSDDKSILTEKIFNLYQKTKLFESVMTEGIDEDEDEDDDWDFAPEQKNGFLGYFNENISEDFFGNMAESMIGVSDAWNVLIIKDFEYDIEEMKCILDQIKEKRLHNQDFSWRCEWFIWGMIPNETVVDDLISWTNDMIGNLIITLQGLWYELSVTAWLMTSAYQMMFDRLAHMSYVQKFNQKIWYVPCLWSFIDELTRFYSSKNWKDAEYNKILMVWYSDFEAIYDSKNDVYNIIVDSDIYYDYLVDYMMAYGAVKLPSNESSVIIALSEWFPPLTIWKKQDFKKWMQINQFIHDMRIARVIFSELDSVWLDEIEFMIWVLRTCNIIWSEEIVWIQIQPEFRDRFYDIYWYSNNILSVWWGNNMVNFVYRTWVVGSHLSDEEIQSYYHKVFNYIYQWSECGWWAESLKHLDSKATIWDIARQSYNPN